VRAGRQGRADCLAALAEVNATESTLAQLNPAFVSLRCGELPASTLLCLNSEPYTVAVIDRPPATGRRGAMGCRDVGVVPPVSLMRLSCVEPLPASPTPLATPTPTTAPAAVDSPAALSNLIRPAAETAAGPAQSKNAKAADHGKTWKITVGWTAAGVGVMWIVIVAVVVLGREGYRRIKGGSVVVSEELHI
jgi:hypothetical protein